MWFELTCCSGGGVAQLSVDCAAVRPVQRVTTCTACSHPSLWVGSRRPLKFNLWGLLGELLVSASLPPVPPLCLCGGDWPGLARLLCVCWFWWKWDLNDNLCDERLWWKRLCGLVGREILAVSLGVTPLLGSSADVVQPRPRQTLQKLLW